MRGWNVIGLFCEDIRQELHATHSLVGVFPDNMKVSHIPGGIPKAGMYIRLHGAADAEPYTIKSRLRLLDGTEHELASFEKDYVARQLEEAKKKGLPHTGFIINVVAAIPIAAEGQMQLIITIGDEELICGFVNIILDPTIKGPTVSSPPAVQSPPAA